MEELTGGTVPPNTAPEAAPEAAPDVAGSASEAPSSPSANAPDPFSRGLIASTGVRAAIAAQYDAESASHRSAAETPPQPLRVARSASS